MRISDWSSDVCSSDLQHLRRPFQHLLEGGVARLDLGSVAARRRLERRGGGPAAGQLHIAPTGQALQLEGSDAVGAHRRALLPFDGDAYGGRPSRIEVDGGDLADPHTPVDPPPASAPARPGGGSSGGAVGPPPVSST